MSHVALCILRGFLVAMILLAPALFLPDISNDAAQAATLLALIAAIVVITEYSASYPGLIEFRDAKPYNRGRFMLLAVIILSLTFLQRDIAFSPDSASFLTVVSIRLADILNFTFSPVSMLVTALPQGLGADHLASVMVSAALAYVLSLIGLAIFFVGLLTGFWPSQNAVFNVWVNLPNFDPTKGVDVVQRLERDGQVNFILGIILPFSLPALLHLSSLLVQPMTLETPLALVWGITLWAFIPVSLVMRGAAMYRVAQLIRAQRRRIAEEEAAVPLPPQSAYSA